MKTVILALAALFLAGGPSTALAAPADVPTALVEAKQNGVSFVTGGIGDAEQAAIADLAKNYNFQVTLTDAEGAYLSDVELAITTSQGVTLVETTARGPILLARMQPGRYLLRAQRDGRTSERRLIDVPRNGSTEMHVTLEKTDAARTLSSVDTATVEQVLPEKNVLKVETNHGPRHYRVTPETEILVQTETIPLTELQPGQRVAISGTREGADFVATRIIAVAKGEEAPDVSSSKR